MFIKPEKIDLKVLKRNIHKIKDIEKQISLNKPKNGNHR